MCTLLVSAGKAAESCITSASGFADSHLRASSTAVCAEKRRSKGTCAASRDHVSDFIVFDMQLFGTMPPAESQLWCSRALTHDRSHVITVQGPEAGVFRDRHTQMRC